MLSSRLALLALRYIGKRAVWWPRRTYRCKFSKPETFQTFSFAAALSVTMRSCALIMRIQRK
jgi:hypothetical protein